MAPREKSSLKRVRASAEDGQHDLKKPRRSQRISSQTGDKTTPLAHDNMQLPSPLTHLDSTTSEKPRAGTATPPSQAEPLLSAGQDGRQHRHRSPSSSSRGSSPVPPAAAHQQSPPNETQSLSQFIYPSQSSRPDVVDEVKEGVWGYLIPCDHFFGDTLILRRRAACPMPRPNDDFGRGSGDRSSGTTPLQNFRAEEEEYEEKKRRDHHPASGYLLGRHPECDRVLNIPTISNRHCLIFSENKGGGTLAVLEDLSSNGTFVNGSKVGRNRRHELQEGDQISILDQASFIFRYPRTRDGSAFRQQYRILQQLGRGHFATVFLCVEKNSGQRFAVKRFEKRGNDKNKNNVLQQEIAVLMGISHPNLLCLKDTYDEEDGVYLVLELAPEGELFNWIVMKQKLSEDDARKVFIQLFQGMKYLHDRGIVHRDIKPENLLLVDKELTVKIADFGLAKMIGEESFTTTLCGTPSYVAPEILQDTSRRRYTKAVDVWSLGVVLYICLCGFPPFSDELYTAENPYRLSEQIKAGRFDYPSPYWDSVTDQALDLIDRMMVVDPTQRATVSECLEHPWITNEETAPPAFSTGSQGQASALTQGSGDSAASLADAMGTLDFSKRKVHRERTLLSAVNDVKVSQVVEDTTSDSAPVKVWEKNANDQRHVNAQVAKTKQDGGKQNDQQASAKEKKDRSNISENAYANGRGGPGASPPPSAKTTAQETPESKATVNGKGTQNGTSTPSKKHKTAAGLAELTPAAARNPDEFMEMGGHGDQILYEESNGSRYP